MTREEFKMMQALPLEIKVLKSAQRIIEAIETFGTDGLYCSYSGGKDSMVLYEVIKVALKKMNLPTNSIPRVFCDTGLEWDSVREIGNKSEIVIRPKMSFTDVIKNHGYPIISKEQSQFIREFRTTKSAKLQDVRWNGGKNGIGRISNKWKPLIESDFNISEKCCDVMKKRPFKKYEKETGRIPILGILACESTPRLHNYLKTGCNAFDNKRPISKPLGFWKEQDILQYIKKEKLGIATIYGELETIDLLGNLKLTKQQRTGCVFCMYGAHHTDFKTFEYLKENEQKKYDYCMNGGSYQEGVWKPDKGLGMAKVIADIRKITKGE